MVYIPEVAGDDPTAAAGVVGYSSRGHPAEAAGVCTTDPAQERGHACPGVAARSRSHRGRHQRSGVNQLKYFYRE